MIAFATLFLGLVIGSRPVEIVVGEDLLRANGRLSSLEIVLDGELVGVLDQAPWVLDCDFGTRLTPHHLEAVARDAHGREIRRIEQWLNLSQTPATVSVVLDASKGRVRSDVVARLSWESSMGAEPDRVRVFLDGKEIPVENPREIPLPLLDWTQFHLFSVELEFGGRPAIRTDLAFGGAYSEEVQTEITAVPIVATSRARKKEKAPDAEAVANWFSKRGASLRVVAVEKAKMEMIFVLDRPFLPWPRAPVPSRLNLTDEHRIRFVEPTPTQSRGVSSAFEVHPISNAFGAQVENLYRLLIGVSGTTISRAARPASAVAVAGLAAYESRNRRAVVLVPSGQASQDFLSPSQVKGYLSDLRVAFFVWENDSKVSGRFEAWGEARPVGGLKLLAKAFSEIEDLLEDQWIVWLDGKHLPQEIELSESALGFELAH